MEVNSVETSGEWSATSVDSPDAAAVSAATQTKTGMVNFLTDVLLAENLVVLTGLGSSMCVKRTDGARLAPSMEALWEAAEAIPNFAKVLKLSKFDASKDGKNIEKLLTKCHLIQSIEPDDQRAKLISDAEDAIAKQCRFVDDTVPLPTHEAFIRALARRSARRPRLKLFTLNYDLCFETAASRSRFVVVDGFSHTQPQQFDSAYFAYDIVRREDERPGPEYIPNVFHLYKLHGSVDWEANGGEVQKAIEPKRPMLIYPRYTKFEASYTPPFLEMVSRFQASLRQTNTGLLVIGYGFGDEHITQPLLAAIRSNVGLKAVFVSLDLTKSPPASPVSRLLALIRGGDRRLMLLNGRFEDLVPALPDLSGPSERDEHEERVSQALRSR